ncbi:MAG: hypothetical protein IT349_10345 [Candidatus Eisenbacteria bacterium]|nr:hypothetical protein [Candidatus Eisenbacteria bacterium]
MNPARPASRSPHGRLWTASQLRGARLVRTTTPARIATLAGSAALIALAFAAPPARAAIPDFTWGDTEVVDTLIDPEPFSSGTNVLRPRPTGTEADSIWYVAYVKSGDVWLARRGDSGWLAPLRVTDEPHASRLPALGEADGGVRVVWEDERTGHPEIWTRSWDGAAWSAEECLSGDAIPSTRPALDIWGGIGLAAWQDEPPSDPSRVVVRLFESDVWEPAEVVSDPAWSAREPAVSVARFFGQLTVVWSDLRHGEAEIYGRSAPVASPVFAPAQRLTYIAGACERPVIVDRPCCGDWINPERLVAFENDATGVSEVWGCCYASYGADPPVPLSAQDGVPSHGPRLAGRVYDESVFGFGGWTSLYSLIWADGPAGGNQEVRLGEFQVCTQQLGVETLSLAGMGAAAVGGFNARGEVDPLAHVLAVWMELRDGVPALVAQEATTPGCTLMQPRGQLSVLLTPEGTAPNPIENFDLCNGEPGWPTGFKLEFSTALRDDLSWDLAFPRPPLTVTSNSQGYAYFPLHGGGCSQAGTAVVKVNGGAFWGWSGAKSPDVDGDCAVRDDDVAYVEGLLGSNDFCADLDGSGVVDAADVAIVQAAYGERCSQVLDAPNGSTSLDPRLRVVPNPTRGATVLRLEIRSAETVSIQILDVAGREVRRIEGLSATAGVNLFALDGRDGSGRELPAGWYLARVNRVAGALSRPFIRVE